MSASEPSCCPRPPATAAVVPVSLPGKIFAAYRSGAGMVPGPAYGRQTFADHLAIRAGALR